MTQTTKNFVYFAIMAGLLVAVGVIQSWSVSLSIFNLCLISAVMALGVNMQWGYAGLFNVGMMGFAAIGGVAAMLVSMPPVTAAWANGGGDLMMSGLMVVVTVLAIILILRKMPKGKKRNYTIAAAVIAGYFLIRHFYDPAVGAIESTEAAKYGYLGGLGMPILFSWIIGGLFAAGAAWLIGKISLGLRADYLAIATLGISEIVIAILKNEDWLTRGVKNVTGLPRPVPYEVDLQASEWFINLSATFGADPIEASSIFVKLCYTVLFMVVLGVILYLSERALNSPWGRMMRAIRDRRDAASAMGKDVKARHLQIFVIGSAVVGIAGAMLTTLDGQFTPGTYNPLRYTFLIWVMVIVGGSGNNWGAVLGGFVIWFLWVEAEPIGLFVMEVVTSGMDDGSALKAHLIESAAHMRMIMMGSILLLVMRFSPKGLMPEVVRHHD
ncbi:branched-chain amino acid ABC transporter permease [Curvivirga aplysinae]|uniref:branched-chain amino acid ABC transporter permease n=1 Tax=Curvivirga aplysinae TaxID=2529852 RepID=UPI0012BB9AF5|nr:branched-chain amino acid ABC transporter permease [Curvivirga aplysinae]MTI10664.1 branched-chain amino acid ABC transporter permease [Curvivirga aplysinae]